MENHEKGYLTTFCGTIMQHDIHNSTVHIDNPIAVIDIDTGSVLKYGDRDKSDITEWYETARQKYVQSGFPEMAESLMLVSFDRYNSSLDIDEICTMLNYMLNHIGPERMNRLLSIQTDELKQEITRLKEIGF